MGFDPTTLTEDLKKELDKQVKIAFLRGKVSAYGSVEVALDKGIVVTKEGVAKSRHECEDLIDGLKRGIYRRSS